MVHREWDEDRNCGNVSDRRKMASIVERAREIEEAIDTGHDKGEKERAVGWRQRG